MLSCAAAVAAAAAVVWQAIKRGTQPAEYIALAPYSSVLPCCPAWTVVLGSVCAGVHSCYDVEVSYPGIPFEYAGCPSLVRIPLGGPSISCGRVLQQGRPCAGAMVGDAACTFEILRLRLRGGSGERTQ